MKTNRENNKEKQFLEKLNFFKEKNIVKILYRGFNKSYAYPIYKLNHKNNNINQFAEKLFYFGEKSRYFKKQIGERNFELNEISNEVFQYVFEIFHKFSNNPQKIQKKRYFTKNSGKFIFFSKLDNLERFLNEITLLSDNQKTQLRNYYFRIIHQLGDNDFKNNSLLVSSSSNEKIADTFSKKNGIKIYFWDFEFNNFHFIENENIPIFNGKPYKNQKEISIFGAIFPHYIYAVLDLESNHKIYNPAIQNIENFEEVILNGFNLNQTNFSQILKNETTYEFGIENQSNNYKLINL